MLDKYFAMWGIVLSNSHPKWAWAKPSTPVLWGYLPVAIAALLGLHPGLVAKALLNNDFVCVCPGSSFGSTYKQYFRVNLAGKILELKKGLNKIVSFFDWSFYAYKKKIWYFNWIFS